jgi:hypothetical protein
MLAARFGSQKDLWRTIGLIVAIRITESQQAAVTDAQQRCSVGVQALSPVLRQVREQLGFVRFAVPVLVDQDLDIARTSNDDATLRIDRPRRSRSPRELSVPSRRQPVGLWLTTGRQWQLLRQPTSVRGNVACFIRD